MPEPARIMIVARWPVGGIRTYLRYVYSTEQLAGHQYAVVCPQLGRMEHVLAAFSAREVGRIDAPEQARGFSAAARRAIRQWRPDLVHTHGFTSAALTAPHARLHRVPHLVTSHDVLFHRQFRGYRGRAKRLGVGWCLRSAQHVMAVGRDALENLQSFYPELRRDGRSSAVRNGIDVAAFAGEERRDLRAEFGLAEETLLLGFFGRFMAQKGFGLLVDAVAQQRAAGRVVQIVCFGWGGFIREEQQALRERGLADVFHFVPHTDDMAAALRGVDVAVMPSRWEACPLLPMEAMVAGAPVIASDCIGMREVVADTPALVFPSGDAAALAQCIEQAGECRAALRERAQAFRATAARRFDRAESARGVAALYRDLMVSAGR